MCVNRILQGNRSVNKLLNLKESRCFKVYESNTQIYTSIELKIT